MIPHVGCSRRAPSKLSALDSMSGAAIQTRVAFAWVWEDSLSTGFHSDSGVAEVVDSMSLLISLATFVPISQLNWTWPD